MLCCFWCNDDFFYMVYYDEEWGVLQCDFDVLFEFLLLEGFQVGLFWIIVLKKCECYCEVLFGFDVQWVVQMSDVEIDELMFDFGIICNWVKFNVVWQNVQVWLELDDLVGFFWFFVGGQLKINYFVGCVEVLVIILEVEVMSKVLCKVGFNFVGLIICYVFMQVSGMVMDYIQDCDCYV